MSVKNRLKKLEKNLSSKQSGFCECFAMRFQTLLNFVYNGVPFKEKDIEVPTTNFCQECRKPVNIALLQAFNKSLQLVYGEGSRNEY